jgi:hypothetical protein
MGPGSLNPTPFQLLSVGRSVRQAMDARGRVSLTAPWLEASVDLQTDSGAELVADFASAAAAAALECTDRRMGELAADLQVTGEIGANDVDRPPSVPQTEYERSVERLAAATVTCGVCPTPFRPA